MKKFDNFRKALINLNEIYNYSEPYDTVTLSGLFALYQICFEQSWKSIKETLEEFGYAESQTGSPRQILKTAFEAGIIKDEQVWLNALASRNNVAHSYNEMIALDIIRQTKDNYYQMFCDLKCEIEDNWMN